MRVLYAAIDQTVPGTVGGSVHVTAVAAGLAELGHEVHVLVRAGQGLFPALRGVHWTAMAPPFGAPALRWMRRRAVTQVARTFKPDVVIERYYNFAGEGIAAGRAVGALTVLEVNAPAVDFPGSKKALLDKALLVQPMRRWREAVCQAADLIVTPSVAMLPHETDPAKIVRLEWGADTVRFHPGASGDVPFPRRNAIVAVFAGAFRSWHGAIHFVRAMQELRRRGDQDVTAVFVGEGPELPKVRAEAGGLDNVHFTGAVTHERMPAILAASDIGVAPFDLSAHGPLALGFYWSPLKIFEYMASGLPVVAPAVDRIPHLIAHEREGVLYDPASPGALAAAIERLADPTLRHRLSAAARERAVRDYSWAAHCEALARAIEKAATS